MAPTMFSMKIHVFSSSLFFSMALGCISLENDKPSLNLATTSEQTFTPVPTTKKRGLTSYRFNGGTFKSEWLTCARQPTGTSAAKTNQKTPNLAIVMHGDQQGFDPSEFCDGWIAQAFLGEGYEVVGLNRPNYGASTGSADFAGEQGLVAMEQGYKAARRASANSDEQESPGVTLLWGYSSGATAAAYLSKQLSAATHLILGGGIYDIDLVQRTTRDGYLKREFATLRKRWGDDAFFDRSIALDPSGLPQRIALYHASGDQAVSIDQAEAFRDTLVSAGHRVTFQKLGDLDHHIPFSHHSKLLRVLARAALQL